MVDLVVSDGPKANYNTKNGQRKKDWRGPSIGHLV